MPINQQAYFHLQKELSEKGVTLIAVSKTKPISDIKELYELGHRDFGENYVQELTDKVPQLPNDIRWHFIGHLQRNKVKYILPFTHLIHGVDSIRLLMEIEKQASKINKQVSVLLQMHIAREETKFGLDEAELQEVIQYIQQSPLKHVYIKGMMGMASFSDNPTLINDEFSYLHNLYQKYQSYQLPNFNFSILSMGMSGDYSQAIKNGTNMVRVGSLLFGARNN
jgi:pyridoxal phosphate enzyme (YggS family)